MPEYEVDPSVPDQSSLTGSEYEVDPPGVDQAPGVESVDEFDSSPAPEEAPAGLAYDEFGLPVSDTALPTESAYAIEPPAAHQAAPASPNSMNVGFGLVVAFALGLALGFFGRPQILADAPIQVAVTVIAPTAQPTEIAQASASTTNNEAVSTADSNISESKQTTTDTNAPVAAEDTTSSNPAETSAEAAPTQTIMDYIMTDARHWQGDEAASVTIVEFSDFK